MKDWINTRKALEIYHQTKPERDKVWSEVNSNEDVFLAEEMEAQATKRVQEAFYGDTKEYNSYEDCLRIHVEDIQLIVHCSIN